MGGGWVRTGDEWVVGWLGVDECVMDELMSG